MATLSSTGRFAAGEACADNDILYGPYATVTAAHAALLNAEQNVVGRTVGIQTGNTIEEYWYQGGTEQANLVKKQTASVEVDSELSSTSENPVQNKVVKSALDGKAPSSNIQKNALASGVQNSLDKADTALQQHQDISGKADKVNNATNGNFAGLDANGNLTNSTYKAGDFATAAQGAKADTAYQKPQSGIQSTDLASGVQTSLGKADTAVQQVTVGTTTTGAAGTNASVTNSGTSTAPVLDFTIPRGADAVNPFKGYFDSLSDLQAKYLTGEIGDFANVYDSTADKTYRYVWDASLATPAWAQALDSQSQPIEVTPSTATFASGQSVVDVHLVNDLTTGGANDVLGAEQGKVLNQQSIYDVTAHNPNAGTNNDGKFASLSVLLNDANIDTLIPTAVRCGGMSIRFVQTSDNKYVQYRLLALNFTTAVTNWAFVGDTMQKKQISVLDVTYTNNSISFGISGTLFVQSNNGGAVENILLPNTIFTFSSAKSRLVLHIDSTLELVGSGTNVVDTDIVLLGYSATQNEFNYGALYSDYIRNTKINKTLVEKNVKKQIHATFCYFTKTSITFNNTAALTIQEIGGGTIHRVYLQSAPVTFSLGYTDRLVLHADDTLEVVQSASDVLQNDIVLLGLKQTGGAEFAFGALFAQYLSSKIQQGIYIEETFMPKFIGGNPVNTNFSSGTLLKFGVGETYALTVIHSQIYNIKPNSSISFSAPITTIVLKVGFYDDSYIQIGTWQVVHQNEESWNGVSITAPVDATKVIFSLTVTDAMGNSLNDADLSVTMTVNSINKTSFFPRSEDSGYQHLTMKVALTDMSSNSYTPSSALQVTSEFYTDNGVLCLPPNYSPVGEAVRLIVFTHGHAVNYGNGATRFNTDDIKPEYWLSEGYAIFDMDGSVTGSFSGNHDFEPASINAYDTAYEWILFHYNVRTDGVFSTGRSMGGGLQFILAKMSKMPILASAPIVPSCRPLGYVDNSITGDARKELLKSYGVPQSELDAISWTAQATPFYQLTNAERSCIESNQWRIMQFTSGFMFNRPLSDEELCIYSEAAATRNESKLTEYYNSVKNDINVSLYNNVPFRIYTCVGDEAVWYKLPELQHKLLANACSLAQIHVFPTPLDHSVVSSNHRFEINPENLITYTNSKGITLQNVPKVYIEILAFWRRFENQDSRD